MEACDLHWLAGLLEGEGSFFTLNRPPKRPMARVSMGSCDYDVIERVQTITGVGRIQAVTRPNRKQHWTWVVQRNNEARQLMVELQPLMGERRAARIAEVLASTPEDAAAPHCAVGHDVTNPSNVFKRGRHYVCRLCHADRRRGNGQFEVHGTVTTLPTSGPPR